MRDRAPSLAHQFGILILMKRKRIDFLLTVLLLALGALVSFYFNPPNPLLAFIYLGIPSFFLMYRGKKNYRKIFWGVLIFGVLMGSAFELIATINGAWSVPRVVFPGLMIGVFPIESVIGYLFMTLFIVVFYEHFLDDERNPRLSPSHSKALLLLLIITFCVFTIGYINPEALKFSWFYLKAGFAAILFPIIFAFYNPHIIRKFAPLVVFFFFVWLLIELVGVANQNWLFPSDGQFVGYATVFGLTFPFEEVFFWFMWYAAVIVAYYEYFVDDRK